MVNRAVFSDETQPIDVRAANLLAQMTLDEKLAQIVSIWVTDLLDSDRQFVPDKAQEHISNGVGQITRIAGAGLMWPAQSVVVANRIQKFLIENTRLGIPAMMHEESCAGYMARGATSFPQAIGLAATWSPDLIEAMAKVIRQQMRRVGAHHALAPVLDIARDSRWGRVEETYGEDPFLVTNIGLAYINGLQGDNLRTGVAATGKHFLAHGIPEGGRNWAPGHVGERELREIFLTPFKAAIQHGRISTIMNAYHELDGVPCGSSRELMVDLLRGELGFDGAVVADYFTLRTLVNYHFVAEDATDAARLGLLAGIDIELPSMDCYGQPLRDGLADGRIDMSLVDASVMRVLTMKLQLGLFENPYVDEHNVIEVFNTAEQRALSRQIAQQSLVLLKNDDVLPLAKDLQRIAVIGPSADSARLMQGDYHYPAHLEHIFDADQNPNAPNPQRRLDENAFNWDEHLPESITVLQGIRAAVSEQTVVQYVAGCDTNSDDVSGYTEAVAAAEAADVAIVVVGDKSGLGKDNTVGESIDSANLHLPGAQQGLIEAIHATGTPVVLVLLIGRAYALNWAAENVPAMLVGWLPAQEGGAAIADVLFGDVSPSGKLPITFPRSVGQVPVYYNHKPSGGRSNWKENYVDESSQPLFPFGYGLSYTQFHYRGLTLSQQEVSAEDILDIHVTVKNTGHCLADEVVQLYVSDPVASVTRPVKMLKGFKRVTLQPGEEKCVHFRFDVRHLAFYNREMAYVVEPGIVRVMIGGSSDAAGQVQAEFEIKGSVTVVEQVFHTVSYVE